MSIHTLSTGRRFAGAVALLAAAQLAPAAPAARPDLRVESVSLSRGVAHLGEVVEATVTLRNLGGVGVNHAMVRLLLGERRIGQDFLVDIGPRASVDISTEFFARPEGKHEFVVVVDPDDEIAESDESNNRALRTLGILSLPREISRAGNGAQAAQDAAPLQPVPDLSVQSLTPQPQPATAGAAVTLRATIHNSGAQPVSGVPVRFVAGGEPLGPDRLVDVPANATATVSETYRPAEAGTSAVSVLVDPAQRLTESTRSNNTRSASVVVVAPPAAAGAEPVPAAPPASAEATAAGAPAAGQPNLVCRIETIQDVHYFDGHSLRVSIANSSDAARASPFMLGLREAGGEGWIVRMPVRGIKPGEELAVDIPWPRELAIRPASRYEVVADVDDDVPELDEQGDNVAGPFSLVVIAAAQPAPAAAAPGTRLEVGRAYRIEWQSTGPVGDTVALALTGQGARAVAVAADARNSGALEWTVPQLEPGQWWITIRSADGAVRDRHGPFTVSAARLQQVNVESPGAGASLFAGETYTIAWRLDGPPDPAARLRLRLRDERTGEAQPVLQDVEVDAGSGRYLWTVPDQPLLFGHYVLEVLRADGRLLGRSAVFEINPAFVSRPESYDPDQIDRRIAADLMLSEAGFDQGFFAFTVLNRGPDNLPSDIAPGVRLRTYFVRRVPVRSSDDYVVCERRLYGWLDAQANQLVELGRDPECPLGQRTADQRFEFAVVRIETPRVIGTLIEDPDPLNNSRRVAFD